MASRLPFDVNPQPKAINGNKTKVAMPPTEAAGRTDAKDNVVRNRILLSMSDGEYEVISSHLELIQMTHHQSLHESENGLEYGYFPNSGLISLVIEINDGRSVEVGITGREGFVGAPLAAGLERTPYRAINQAPGEAFRIKAEVLQVSLAEMPQLRQRLIRYAVIQGMQVAQLAACNRLHEIDQRLARWLLMCQDRLGDDLLPMTHEFFAEMLGTGRPTVSVAAAVLQRAGFIQYARGTVKITNREGLETAACECYRAIQQLSLE